MGKTQRIVGVALIALALVLAGYAWVLSERMTAQQQQEQPRLVPVVVASARIPAGSAIAPEMVRLAMFPARPDGAYTDVKAVVGKTTASDLAAGEPLLQERLEGGPRPMLQHLETDERAVAVRVDDVIAVGNRLNPGDQVDVYLTLRRNSEEISATQSRLLLERLRVLAFGNKDVAAAKGDAAAAARGAADNPRTAVLAVKIADVEKLALAAESGRLLLALRPQEKAPEEGAAAPLAVKAEAATQAAVAAPALTLRDLIDKRPEKPGTPAAVARGAAPSTAKAVTVMHGLKEKTVYLGTRKSEARP